MAAAAPAATAAAYELYRGSSIGMALADSLDALIASNDITPQLAVRIMERYDRSVAEILRGVKAKTTLKGHLHTYRFLDDVWSFQMRSLTFKMEGNEQVTVPRMKIIACRHPDASDGKPNKSAPAAAAEPNPSNDPE